jgi:acetoin:2,6-dichlorophenolindophenol oxidoreductase subunit alpha
MVDDPTTSVDESGRADTAPTADELLDGWTSMVLVRRAEERLASEFAAGSIPGGVHLYIGQEAVAVGFCSQLDDRDMITSTHRGHGHFLAKGGELDAMFAEIWGKSEGICGGMGGSMHVADVSKGILGANGIVAGGMAIAAGAAYGALLDRRDHDTVDRDGRVAVCFFGDGAANQGVLMETMNMAALWQLPLVFVCENNQFSEFTPSRDITVGRIGDRARPFDIPVSEVDGNDLEEVWNTAATAIGRARSGGGPTFVEAHTYRIHGHMEREKFILGDGAYRDDSEIDDWRERDPIARLRARLVDRGVATDDQLDEIDATAAQRVDDAVARAEAGTDPDPDLPRRLMFAGREV